MVLSIILAFIAVFPLPQTFAASQQTTLYRDQQISFINFKQERGKRLSAEKLASLMVKDVELDCAFKCVGEPKCFSFNIAAYPDAKNLHLCEMLATDKYRAMLQTNASFHHYSPLSPCESNPCQNNGDCVPDFKQNSYHCDCKAGFSGTHCEACKFDFEDEISGWVRTGMAFNNQPTFGDNPTARNRGQPANQQGDWWIGGAEDRPSPDIPGGQRQGDGPQGNLTSPSFNIKGNSISFLIGGGCDISFVRAELIIESQVVRNTTGKCTESMVRETWDVQEFIGERAHVKLVDVSSGDWGHINFDDLKGDISCDEN